ncbi:MAG: hypothetical protein HY855_04515 [Burkholderiales bacterium]|nr:hypothetical protein [Burkholderiales bacterium]
MKQLARLCSVLCMLCVPALAWCAEPVVTLRANGGRGPVVALAQRPVQLTIGVDAGSQPGTAADWWLVARSGDAWYSYQLQGAWLPGLLPTYQGPLQSFPTLTVTTLNGLPAGRYTLYFGIDRVVNGQVDADLRWDAVALEVPGWRCPPASADSQAALSPVQQRFIASRGNPALFTLLFITQGFDAQRKPVALAEPRRVETWVYNQTALVSDTFDSGHFVGETAHGEPNPALKPTPWSPSRFGPCMTREDVVALVGEPACTVTEDYGARRYEYLKYPPSVRQPAATVVLENGVLNAVMAGYAWLRAPQGSLALCP